MRISRSKAGKAMHVAAALTAFLLLSGTASPANTVAQDTPIDRDVAADYASYISEASQRFGIPEHWIRAVMQVESAGRVRAVSSAGAMGLMQLMPRTWAELRRQHELGDDPFDPRNNILGGTAYLRQMYDRFGAPGFLAAYNAGPGRYQEHLATGRPLPRETRAYVARLMPMIDTETAPRPIDWREAPLFIERSSSSSAANVVQKEHTPSDVPPTRTMPNEFMQNEPAKAVLVPQSRNGRAR